MRTVQYAADRGRVREQIIGSALVESGVPAAGGSQRVLPKLRGTDEALHTVEERQQHAARLRQSQKMEAIGRLAGGVAHDFSNLLTVITGACERLQDRVGTVPSVTAEIDLVLRTCDRAASLTRQLLAFSRQETLAPRPIDLCALVRQAAHFLKRLIGEHVNLTIDVPGHAVAVVADPTQLEQVLMNLAINARDAMPDGGSLNVGVKTVAVDDAHAASIPLMKAGHFVLLQVSDNGAGMVPETRRRAFEPFFTTKDPADGTGLGLATVYGIVQQCNGYIGIDSEVGRGTTFQIFLPPTTAQLQAIETAKFAAPSLVKPATLLLVEDEDDVRTLLCELLESCGHHVLRANSPAQAMSVSTSYRSHIDLLVTDVVMPGGTGRDLAKWLAGTRPEMRVLYISGYPEHDGPDMARVDGAPFLPKPFTRDLLMAKLAQVLEQ
jgi:two-component system, cell cycle sensor histidine kinase and response regulator CckA